MGYSQLGTVDGSAAKAAIMELFAWLPPGSFPLIADSVFSFASHQIKVGTENGMSCGLLVDILAREDDLLDIRSSIRAQLLSQTGGNQVVNDSLLILTSEYIDHAQREAVLHFLPKPIVTGSESLTQIQDFLTLNEVSDGPPTPLHEVGTWREPPVPSKSAEERLMNAAVHVFAATFALQGGHQQITAINMLEGLVQNEGGGKNEDVTSTNVTATLLSCLKSLPSNEGLDGGITGTGPPWVSRCVRLFFQLLQSSRSLVRRGAAEGLGLLASLGIKEVYNQSLQATGNENAIFKNAGCLLTFGCIHRAASGASYFQSSSSQDSDNVSNNMSSIPSMTMLTRLLPYTATHTSDEDSFLIRTHAIQSFCLILSHSRDIYDRSKCPEEHLQVLSKAVEIVENNIFGAWKSNTSEVDNKSFEVSFFFKVGRTLIK